VGVGSFFPGVSLPGREAENSPPPGAEVKNAPELYLHSPYVFRAWCLVKYRIVLMAVI